MGYALTTEVEGPFDEVLEQTRAALSTQGFGVLTEIDMAATLKTKLDVDIDRQVILGACRPPLAHRALQVDPSIGLLLPCNVVVRAIDADHTRVEAIDPGIMVTLSGNPALADVAADARTRLTDALNELDQSRA